MKSPGTEMIAPWSTSWSSRSSLPMSSFSTRSRWQNADQRDAAVKIIKSLNPDAKLIETDFCDVPLDEVLDTGLFSLERAEMNPLWFKELNGFKDQRAGD